jgi:polysaccharide biosynthesis transport protein
MLRTDNKQFAQSGFGEYPPVQSEPGLGELFTLAVGFLRRQYLIILSVALVVVGGGLLYLRFAPVAYTAHAKIITDIRKGQFLKNPTVLLDAPIDAAQLDGQMLILKSEPIAISVIKEFDLLNDPEFAIPETGENSGDAGSSLPERMQTAIAIFESKLQVMRVGQSYAIDIGFESRNPKKAAKIANAIANGFIAQQQEAQFQTNQTVGNWLQNRLNGIREQVSNADRRVVEFAREHNIISADGKLMDDQRLADLNTRLVAARSRTSEALARLYRIQAVIRKDRVEDSSTDAAPDATVTDALNDSIVTNLRQKYLDLVNRTAEWSARYGPDHQAVVRLRNQQRELRDSIHAELQRLAESYKSDYAIARQHENETEQQLARAVSQLQLTNQEQIKLQELKSSAQSYHSLYDGFLRQYTESVEQNSFPLADARVISHAAPPTSKSRPKSRLILAISLLGGVCLGFGVGILRELMDRVFRTSDQIENLLHRPCVAVIPLLDDTSRDSSRTDRKLISTKTGPRMIARSPGVLWTLVDSPSSRFAEGIRSIKLALDATHPHGGDRPNKVIGFTSSLPCEGKSTIVAAAAQLTAQTGKKVIVVDCDLRNPSLSRIFTNNSGNGFVEVVAGRLPLEDVVWREPTTNFSFLPVGNSLRFTHTSDILSSELTRKFFDDLRQRYDYVIVDLPPLAPIVDVRATVGFIDSYFVVVAWGETKVDIVQHALHSAEGVYDSLGGVILNKTNFNALKRYDVHRGKYYHNKHYSRYGYTE